MMKKTIIIASLFLILCTPFARAESPLQDISFEGLKDWVGKSVSVSYACCGEASCEILLNVKLKEVTEKYIVVIANNAPFLIPKYMIQTLVKIE